MVKLPQVAIPHVIGTAILIGLIGVVVLYSNNIQYSTFLDATKESLNEVAGYVAAELVTKYSLVSVEPWNQTVYKVINIPTSINKKGYSIRIYNDSGVLKIVAFLDENPNINASVILGLYGEVRLFDAGIIILDGSNHIEVVDRLYSGVPKPVVIVKKVGNNIFIGLGKLTVGI